MILEKYWFKLGVKARAS